MEKCLIRNLVFTVYESDENCLKDTLKVSNDFKNKQQKCMK